MHSIRISGGRVLSRDAGLVEADLFIDDGRIAGLGTAGGRDAREIDARGLLVLPGLVDLHGDAFERQIQPRPGVGFPIGTALVDTDAQLLASGITTAYLAVTLSWEPGLRSLAAYRSIRDELARLRPALGCDARLHLRWEAYNLDALDEAIDDVAAGRVGMLGLNDHTPAILRKVEDPRQGAKYSDRAGMTLAEFRDLAHAVGARAAEVPAALARIAAAARAAGLPVASHDDGSVADRDRFRALGAGISEFPTNEAVALAARAAGDGVVMGCPNVVRGGSHMGWAGAAAMVASGACDVLCSDYYYPAMRHAAARLADGRLDRLAAAWALVSANPARAAGLADRGAIAPGLRADLVLVPEAEVASGGPVRVAATLVAGRVAFAGPALRGAFPGAFPIAG